MIKLLANNWTAALIGSVIYLTATVLFWKNPAPAVRKMLDAIPVTGPSWDFNNPEADLLISELKIEKKSADQRQQELDDLATRLNTERAEVGQVIQSVRKLQAEFDQAVLRVKDEEKGNLKKLAKMYGVMAPESAAAILEQLDNDAIVKIMLFLKNEETAAILEAMSKKSEADARRTAQICEQIRLSSQSPTNK